MCQCCCKFSNGVGLAVCGLVVLFIGIGGAIGFMVWYNDTDNKGFYWTAVGFIVFGVLGACFLLLAVGLAVWACFKECRKQPAAAPAPAPPAPHPSTIVVSTSHHQQQQPAAMQVYGQPSPYGWEFGPASPQPPPGYASPAPPPPPLPSYYPPAPAPAPYQPAPYYAAPPPPAAAPDPYPPPPPPEAEYVPPRRHNEYEQPAQPRSMGSSMVDQ